MVVFEYGPNLGGVKVSELVCSYSTFEGDIADKLEGEKTVSGIKYVIR